MFPLAAPLTPPQQNTPLSLWKGHCSPHSWQNSDSTVPFTTVSPGPPASGAELGVWHQPQKEAWKRLYFESVNKQIIQWCSNTSLAWFSSNFSLKNIQKKTPKQTHALSTHSNSAHHWSNQRVTADLDVFNTLGKSKDHFDFRSIKGVVFYNLNFN